jgi:hypothetical protein
MVSLTQTVHLSCVKISTIPKHTEMTFHLSLINLEYRLVRPKWFMTLWYVWRKPCTYLALTLTPSRNGPKRGYTSAASPRSSIGFVQNDFQAYGMFWHKPCTYLALTQTPTRNRLKRDLTWLTSPRSSIGCVQNNFWAYGTFGVNNAPILHQDLHYLQMDRNELPLEPHHLGVSLGASKMISEPMVCLAQTVHLSCSNITPSLIGPKQDSIGCVQNDFHAYGTFDTNHTPILHQD